MSETYTQLALFTITETTIWYKGKVQRVLCCIDWNGNFTVLEIIG